jgi:sirohydrochlorin ferrochelatase
MECLQIRVLICLFVLPGAASCLMGQTSNGSIRGRVTDPTGATVPGAAVELTSIERGTAAKAITNDAGLYLFATVQPGDYRLAVQKDGFKESKVARN